MLVEPPYGYPIGDTRTIFIEPSSKDNLGSSNIIPDYNQSSKPRSQKWSDLDALKQGSQKSQISLKEILILFIIHIIAYYYSCERDTWTLQWVNLAISHIRLNILYGDTYALLSSYKSRIYNKE